MLDQFSQYLQEIFDAISDSIVVVDVKGKVVLVNPAAAQFEGTGVGLAIVANITKPMVPIRRHGRRGAAPPRGLPVPLHSAAPARRYRRDRSQPGWI
jgi:PAS domain-containing protein